MSSVQLLMSGQAAPVSLASADFDEDGINDLAVGYSAPTGGLLVVHRGNIDAFAPQSAASLKAIGQSQFPAPFLKLGKTIELPVTPDFLATGSVDDQGKTGIVAGARNGHSLYIVVRNIKGDLTISRQIDVDGALTALTTANLNPDSPYSTILAGITTPSGDHLLVLEFRNSSFTPIADILVPGAVTSIVSGDLYADHYSDLAVASAGQLLIVNGRVIHEIRAGLRAPEFRPDPISLPVSASSLTTGSFLFDRDGRLQLAVLAADGSTHIITRTNRDGRAFSREEILMRRRAVRQGLPDPLVTRRDPNEGWQVAESFPAFGSSSVAGQSPLLFRTHLSNGFGDDAMLLDSATGQLHVFAHGVTDLSGKQQTPAHLSMALNGSGPVVAAISTRVNIDGRPGLVVLKQGQVAPEIMMPLPDPTFFVNRLDDPSPGTTAATCNNVSNADTSSSCSLREAVLKANATAGTDTITLAAGTYTLTIARVNGDNTGAHGGLYINDSVTIVGAGQANTIIQGGISAAAGVDLVFAVNEDIQTITNASASFSNLTIKFGHNRGSVGGTDGDGGCMEYDTGSSGTANLTLTNVTISNCVTQDGNGGGIAIFNASSGGSGGTGLATISNSIFQNNSVAEVGASSAGSGGAIWVADLARMSLSNSQILNNSATQVNGSGRGVGGGIFIFSAGPGSRQTVIHGSTISGNSAAGDGGGIWSASNLSIDSSGGLTTITGNSAGANGGGSHLGGGISLNTAPPDSTTLTKVTITGNTATGNGGGIASGNDSAGGALTMSFSRIAGNTAAAGVNLDNNHTTITATNNWWGTNSPLGTITNTSSTTTFDPFIQLTNTASPNSIHINQSSSLTADMSKDNHGSGTNLAGNLDVLSGIPVTFNNPNLGTIPQAQPETIAAAGTSTATFNAGSTGGSGHADATVDQATVTANITILAPLQITKSFSPTTVAVNATSTLTFSITNPNIVAVDGSFTDTFPAGLVVAATPNVTNSCGGTVTATAGSGSVSFSNASLAVGACTITVAVKSASDGTFNNSVTIDSTAAGTGAQSTSNATLTVTSPPSITKAFGASTVPLNGATSLTFTITNSNTALSLTGVAFTDSLPAGLVVTTPSGLNSTCGGTATATGGATSVSLSGASLTANTSCAISVNVTGTTSGVKLNSVSVSSTNGGSGNTSNASVTVVTPPTIAKAFSPTAITLNGSTTLSFTIQNNNTATNLTGVAFTDSFPSGLKVATPNGLTGSCGSGTITATAGTATVSLSGATVAANSSCSFSVNVTGISAGLQSNTTGSIASTEGGTGGTASASVSVEAPPTIGKSFTPSTIALNATTSLTFTLTNPTGNPASLTGVAFTDTLPTGLTVANASATVCGGTLTTTAPTGISLTGATIALNGQCQFSVTVTGAASGQFTNTTGNVTSTNGGTGNTASANLTVASPASITKTFGALTVPLNGTTTLTFAIQNSNSNVGFTGLAFTDSMPAGLVVASTPALSNTCGGTATAVAGSSAVSLSAGTLAASSSCSVTVNVTGTTVGPKSNSVTVSTTETGTGNTSTTSIGVLSAPTIAKAFGAVSVPLNGSTSLTFTIQNNNTANALTGIAFTDNFPVGVAVATPNGLTGSCGVGTITPTANGISLANGSIAANSSCTFSVNVTGTTAGAKTNTTGNVTSTEGGTGGTASAPLNVEEPPSIAKVFNPAGISLHSTTSLTFTLTNPAANAVALSGAAFTDTLPTGLTVASATATVCGGTLTTTSPTEISLTGATIAANGQCQFSVTVTGAASGQYTNTTGNVTSTNGGTGNTASANLTVATAPSIAKAFGVTNIPLNGTTSLSFTITNPSANTFPLTGIAFTDSLPAGLNIATQPNLTNSCGGTASAVAGDTSVALANGTIASGAACSVSVNVTGTTIGSKNNSVTVTSNEAGTGNTANATVTVNSPPTISKAFSATSIPLNGSTLLTFTLQNNNSGTALTGVGFTDTLPSGLIVSAANGLTGVCGGTVTAAPGTDTVNLSGGNLPANGSCTIGVNVMGSTAGMKNNVTGNVTSTQGGTGTSASASLDVVGPPSISKSFTPSTIAPNLTSSLDFTITNPAANSVALTGVAFVDTLPAGLTIASPSGLTGSCGAGTITAAAGTNSISLVGATIAANGSCSFAVDVTGPLGSYTNTTGTVSSTNGGTGNAATATLLIGGAPSIAKTFGSAAIGLGSSTSLTFAITNPNSSLVLSGIAFSDPLPAGLIVATPNGLTGNCGSGTITAAPGSQNVSLSGGNIAAASNCTFGVNVVAVAVGAQVNTTGNVTSTNGG
ncbi:MAG TPA: hypothetical protein VGF44_15740, partial [Terriglobales bacterium]